MPKWIQAKQVGVLVMAIGAFALLLAVRSSLSGTTSRAVAAALGFAVLAGALVWAARQRR